MGEVFSFPNPPFPALSSPGKPPQAGNESFGKDGNCLPGGESGLCPFPFTSKSSERPGWIPDFPTPTPGSQSRLLFGNKPSQAWKIREELFGIRSRVWKILPGSVRQGKGGGESSTATNREGLSQNSTCGKFQTQIPDPKSPIIPKPPSRSRPHPRSRLVPRDPCGIKFPGFGGN